jgi:hypothetical protein
MRPQLILQQHSSYSYLINNALHFCESVLRHTDVLYPFALLADNTPKSEISCIFIPHNDQLAQPHMIESLQAQIETQKVMGVEYVSVLVYAAAVNQANTAAAEALVFTITDTQGHNTVAIYPYEHVENGIKISPPCTCNFLD